MEPTLDRRDKSCAAGPMRFLLLILGPLLAAAPAYAAEPGDTHSQWHTPLFLAVAFVLGTAIGLERQLRQRAAGLRTTVLVAVGAAAFADLGFRLLGPQGATQLVAYIISGIGFLGAGVIMKDGGNISGLNTAATLWCSAAVGAFSGAGLPIEAALVTMFVLSANTLLRPLVNWVNRRPLQGPETEAQYIVHVICTLDAVPDVRDLMESLLDQAGYPIQENEVLSDLDDAVELGATLIPTTAVPEELDRVVAALERSSKVRSATWTVSAVPN
jgi:putative Mg2+ transporter-C (MgtC) family protein